MSDFAPVVLVDWPEIVKRGDVLFPGRVVIHRNGAMPLDALLTKDLVVASNDAAQIEADCANAAAAQVPNIRFILDDISGARGRQEILDLKDAGRVFNYSHGLPARIAASMVRNHPRKFGERENGIDKAHNDNIQYEKLSDVPLKRENVSEEFRHILSRGTAANRASGGNIPDDAPERSGRNSAKRTRQFTPNRLPDSGHTGIRASDIPPDAGAECVLDDIGASVERNEDDAAEGALRSIQDLSAPRSETKPESSDEQTIARLAGLPAIEYDRVRQVEAERLGVRVNTLDDQVKRLRGAFEEAKSPLEFESIEPWQYPVDGAQLLDGLSKAFSRYLVLPQQSATALALWVLFTHLIDSAEVAPILAVVSPEKRCGKSTLLALLSRLVYRPMPASNISPAAIFRSVEAWKPTLLIDEADTFVRENEELRGIVNSGHTRSSAYVVRTVGDDHEPKRFSTWSAKAIALIGRLPDTLEDRSIAVEMRRKLPSERVEKLRHAEPDQFLTLRQKCARFAADNVVGVKNARPAIPGELHDRAADNWEPLLAIADVAGGEWPQISRQAASIISGATPDGDSTKTELLRDIQTALGSRLAGRSHVGSAELIQVLTADNEARWCEFSHGKPVSARQLAKLLRPFGIVSGTVRFGTETAKGYSVEGFTDAFARYLPPSDPSHRHKQAPARVVTESAFVTERDVLRIANPSQSSTGAGCDGVTDKNPLGSTG